MNNIEDFTFELEDFSKSALLGTDFKVFSILNNEILIDTGVYEAPAKAYDLYLKTTHKY